MLQGKHGKHLEQINLKADFKEMKIDFLSHIKEP